MNPASNAPAGVAFGRFQVWPHRREVLADGQPIKLGGRAFDVLMALIEARGEVVGKDTLMSRVWADRVVEAHNLEAQISALRAAFGSDRDLIRTVSHRGYQFTGEIRVLSGSPDERAVAGMAAAVRPPTNLPAPVSELIGRDDGLQELLSLVAAHRLVTLTGAGGIGKTRLACAAARQILPRFADGVWLAEFSPLSDPGLVPATVAAAVGLELGGGEASAQRVAQALAERPLLLLLDTCEHVIDAAAGLAEAVMRAGSAVHVIATSREPLRVEGEWTYPVPPLDLPAEHAEAGDDPLRYGAVRLFIERARAAQLHFVADRRLAALIAAICRRLDGIPLAIELAASRAAVLGVEEVATGLDDLFRLLTGGRRTALPRHQTLRATLDWSYELLSEPERVVLRRLGVFAGAFSLEAARAVVASAELAPSEVIDDLANLVAKSLVAAEVDGTVAHYRLLDTTRAYALEKLAESGEFERTASLHATHYCSVLVRAGAEAGTKPLDEWLGTYGRQIDDVRKALDWAFSPSGDPKLGVALAAAALPLWMHLSLMNECRSRVEQAISCLPSGPDRSPRLEMQLFQALGAVLLTIEDSGFAAESALRHALGIAESLDETDYQLRILWCSWAHALNRGAFSEALALADRFRHLATRSTDLFDPLNGERMRGFALHFLGDQDNARRLIEYMLSRYVAPAHRFHIIRFQGDQKIAARAILVQILWLQGFVDQALETNETNVEEAGVLNHTLSLCNALTKAACPVSLMANDLPAAERFIGMLTARSARDGLPPVWNMIGNCFKAILSIKQGAVSAGLDLLGTTLAVLPESRFSLRYPWVLGEYADGMRLDGRISDGLRTIEEALEMSERDEELWCRPELLRIKGELLQSQGGTIADQTAEQHFLQSIDWARRQGALSWELRGATSLARLQCDQGRSADALALLQPVYDQFTEGFDAADLKSAKALLDALAEPGRLRLARSNEPPTQARR